MAETLEERLRRIRAEVAAESTAPAPADDNPIIAGGKIYPSMGTTQRMGESSATVLKTVVPPVLEALNLPSKALGAVRGQEYLLKPETESAQAAIPGTGALSKIARAGVGMAGQIASDPLTLLGGLGLLSKLGKSGNLAKAVTTAAELPADVIGGTEKVFAKMAAAATGVKREALEKAATSEGRAALAASSGEEAIIGDKLKEMVNNFEDITPERAIIEGAVKDMPAIELRSVIRSLEHSKELKPKLSWQHQANAEIQKEIDQIRDFADKHGWGDKQSTMISAQDYYDLRKALDFKIKWDAPQGDKYVAQVNNAFGNARQLMADEINRAAAATGKPEVADAFSSWSDKIKKLQAVKKAMGSNVESFIANLFGKNKVGKQEAVKAFEELFGEDITDQAKNAFLARSFGPEAGGVPGWFPAPGGSRAGTIMAPVMMGSAGYARSGLPGLLAAIPGAMVTSPKVASATIGGLNTAEDAARWLGRLIAEGKTAPLTAGGDVLRTPVAAFAQDEEERRRHLLSLGSRR